MWWRRGQRRLRTEFVEPPPGITPDMSAVEVPVFAPDLSFGLPEPSVPSGLLAETLAGSAKSSLGPTRLPDPPPFPAIADESVAELIDPSVAPESAQAAEAVSVDVRFRERVILGESVNDSVEQEAHFLAPDLPPPPPRLDE